jgi:RNA polymerase primary sigma factor
MTKSKKTTTVKGSASRKGVQSSPNSASKRVTPKKTYEEDDEDEEDDDMDLEMDDMDVDYDKDIAFDDDDDDDDDDF